MNVPRDPHSEEVEAPRPLLCAVDQSIEAREAADVAAGLAARLDAPLVLAHVLADRPAFPHGSAVEVERHRGDPGLSLGVGIASASAFLTVWVMFVFPLWAIAVLAVDFLILYCLLTRSDEFA